MGWAFRKLLSVKSTSVVFNKHFIWSWHDCELKCLTSRLHFGTYPTRFTWLEKCGSTLQRRFVKKSTHYTNIVTSYFAKSTWKVPLYCICLVYDWNESDQRENRLVFSWPSNFSFTTSNYDIFYILKMDIIGNHNPQLTVQFIFCT